MNAIDFFSQSVYRVVLVPLVKEVCRPESQDSEYKGREGENRTHYKGAPDTRKPDDSRGALHT